MSDITELYIDAVTRTLPPETKAERAGELRTRIENRIAERTATGEPHAEVLTLLEVGDRDRRAGQGGEPEVYLLDPDMVRKWLPEPSKRHPSGVQVFGAFLGALVVSLLLLWDQLVGFIPWQLSDGRLPIINPALWPWSLVAVAGLAAAGAFIERRAFLRRRWTAGHATGNAILALAGGALALWLHLAGVLANPDFLAFFAQQAGEGPVRVVGVLVTLGIIVAAVFDAAEGFWRLRTRTA